MKTGENEIGKTRAFWLMALLLTGILLPIAFIPENVEAQPRIPHNPIYISGDAGFLSPSSGVTGGTGTENDPFIIENWDINSAVINGIYIENTQSYAIIRNVWTHRDNWAVDYNGIVISNAEHITIEDCESTDNWIGIVIGSSDVTLKNNIINDNNHGVSLNYGSRESIPKMEGNLVNGINIDGTINKEEQCYFYNENDLVFDGKVEKCESEDNTGGLTYQGILTLYDCENFIIKNCQLENNAVGILLGHSNGTITDNLILNNTWFIAVECYSSSPLIARNNISQNGCGGIHCSGGSSPHIRDNYIGYNTAGTGYGIRMMDADSNPIIENNAITGHRPHDGIWVDEGSTPIVRNNLIYDNLEGIAIQRRSGGIFENNTISGNDIGIFTGTGSTPLIQHNQIIWNIRGIHCPNGLGSNEDTLIMNNNISNNRDEGIFCFYHSNPQIRKNLISQNDVGICCRRDANPGISNNSIFENRRGVVVEGRNSGDNHYPSRPIIHENDFIGNTEYGVYNDDDGDNANLDENGEQVIIDAENNWWNAENGPGGAGPGSGDAVSEYVDYEPWRTEPLNANRVPSILIVEPERLEVVSSICAIRGTASDPDGDDELVKVEVKIDDGNWEEANGTTSWSLEWDTMGTEYGEYTIYARAYDGEDYSQISEVNVTVDNEEPQEENHPPTIDVTSVEKADDYTYQIAWTASDQDGDTLEIDLYYDTDTNPDNGRNSIEKDLDNTGSYDWDILGMEDGDYYILAVAQDPGGGEGSDYSAMFTISLPELAPDFAVISLELTPPAPEKENTVVIRVIVKNQGTAQGTGNVDFLADGVQLESKSLTLQCGREKTLTTIWNAVEGNHTITVRVNVAGDSEPENNEQERKLSVAGAPGGREKENDDDFPVVYVSSVLALAVVVVVGVVAAYKRKENVAYLVQCPACGSETQYSEEEEDHYCWECEEYVGEMKEEVTK